MRHLPRDYVSIQPTVLDPEQARRYIGEVIEYAEHETIDRSEVAEALVEMLCRLSDTYSDLTPELEARVWHWVQRNFAIEPYALLDALCTILTYLPAPETLAFIERQQAHTSDLRARRLLRETRDEIRELLCS